MLHHNKEQLIIITMLQSKTPIPNIEAQHKYNHDNICIKHSNFFDIISKSVGSQMPPFSGSRKTVGQVRVLPWHKYKTLAMFLDICEYCTFEEYQ
mmetsp:Transcript_1745/g.2351  ORF Transcript_1745/g.2351 Transcript_1745/m.2351 type:complete len:95 (+) Transcript_1745:17-301(+)